MLQSYDLPWGLAFGILVDNPDVEVVGRISRRVDEDGSVWTWLDGRGDYGYRLAQEVETDEW